MWGVVGGSLGRWVRHNTPILTGAGQTSLSAESDGGQVCLPFLFVDAIGASRGVGERPDSAFGSAKAVSHSRPTSAYALDDLLSCSYTRSSSFLVARMPSGSDFFPPSYSMPT